LWRSRVSRDPEEAQRLRAAEARAQRATHSQWIAVALVTMANGGDSLGVYIPLVLARACAGPRCRDGVCRHDRPVVRGWRLACSPSGSGHPYPAAWSCGAAIR
jgi:hypothetical protein